MKTKTLFLSSLVAAAAMSTVPAFADISEYDATNKKINWISADNAYKWVGSSSGAFSTASNWVTGTGLNGTPSWSDTNTAPVRVNNQGDLLYFDGTRQTISVSGTGVNSSDGGGIWVTGTGNTVTASIGEWAGSIQVEAGNVLNTSWTQQLKDGHIVAKGTVNVTSGNLNMDGDTARTWFVGADGSITFGTATTISTPNGTGSITLLGEVETLSSELTNRTASGTTTLTKQLVAFSSSTGITTGLDLLTVGTISDAGTGTALESATSADSLTVGQYYADKSSSGVTVSYAVNTYTAETLTWAGTESSSVWVNKGDNWTNASNVQTSFLNGDSVTFNKANADVTVSGTVAPGVMTVSQATTLSGTGTVSVAQANLTLNAALTLGDAVALDLGSGGDTIGTSGSKLALSGTGTVKYSFTSTSQWGGGTNSGIYISDDFAGTVDYTGCLNYGTNISIGSNATLKFSSRTGQSDEVWSNSNTTIANKLIFATDYGVNVKDGTTLTLSGDISGAGTMTKKGDGTLNISGTMTNAFVAQSAGTMNISGTGTKTITALNFSGANSTLNISGTGTNTITTLTAASNDGTNRTISIAEGTTVSVGTINNAWGIKTLTVDGSLNVGTMTYSSGDMTNTITGSGTLNVTGTFTAKNVGTYIFDGGLSTNIGTLTVNRPTTFSNTGTNTITTLTVDNTLNISGALTKVTGTYSGEGTLNVNDGAVLDMEGNGTSTNQVKNTINVKGGGTLKFSGHDLTGWSTSTDTVAVLASDSADKLARLDINDTGTMTFTHVVAMNGNALISTSRDGGSMFNTLGGKITATGTNNTISDVVIQIRSGFEVAVSGKDDELKITSAIVSHGEGTGGITKTGTGTLILSNENSSLTRAITISEGTLVAANASALGKSKVSVASGASLGLVAGTTVEVAGGITLAEGAKIVIDMTDVDVSETETFTLDLITGTALTYGETSITSDNADSTLKNVIEFSNWSESSLDDWTQKLTFDDSSKKLSLSLTKIPEPSAFGLLAGVGALVFVAARRRRRAK